MLKAVAVDIVLLVLAFFVIGCIIGCLARRNLAMFFGEKEPASDVPDRPAEKRPEPVTKRPEPVKASAPAPAPAPAAATRPGGLKKPRGDGADDLKRINGVGPVLEKKLHELGYFHFDQIAAWTPDNVAWVDDHLNFKGRIERDKWIAQAKELMKNPG